MKKFLTIVLILAIVILGYIFFVDRQVLTNDASTSYRMDLPAYPVVAESTVEASDFAGSEACAACHTDIYQKWKASTHGNAGGDVDEANILGEFDGKPRPYNDAVVTPYKEGNKYFFKLTTDELPDQVYEVTSVVGGGHMVGGGTQTYFTLFPDGTLRFIPFDYHVTSGQWFGETSGEEGWIPMDENRKIDKVLEAYPTRALGFFTDRRNCQECHGSQIQAVFNYDEKKYETSYTTLQINCESCHGPAKKHIELVSEPGWEDLEFIGLRSLESVDKDASLMVCFQCHALKDPLIKGYLPGKDLTSHYALKYPIHSSQPYLNDGKVREFGYQQNHLASDCYINGSMTCVDCHDPHEQSYRDVNYQRISDRFDDNQCLSCHASKAADIPAHTFHQEGSQGSKCVNCHMPYLQHQGTGNTLRFARSDHTIPIPRPTYDTENGIQNACAGCHDDMEIGQLEAMVRTWYGELKPLNPSVAGLDRAHPGLSEENGREALLDTTSGHLFGQMAGISRFTRQYLQPEMEELSSETIEALKAFARSKDPDVRSLAMASLHLSADQQSDVHNFLVNQLGEMDNLAQRKIRDRWAHAMPYFAEDYERKGDFETSLVINLKAAEVNPENASLLLNIARIYESLGQPRMAVEYYNLVLEKEPQNVLAWLNLGNSMLNMGDLEKARTFYNKTLEIDPWNYFAYFNLGKLDFQERKYTSSVAYYQKAINLYPTLPYVYVHMAYSLAALNRGEEVKRAAKTALWLDPNDPRAKQILARVSAD